jgi:hypothetical protein
VAESNQQKISSLLCSRRYQNFVHSSVRKGTMPAHQNTAEVRDEDTPLQPEIVEENAKTVDPRNALNDLNATEWIPETASV